jgi:RNase H-fold protein (predicted Holliday junction resolvase)
VRRENTRREIRANIDMMTENKITEVIIGFDIKVHKSEDINAAILCEKLRDLCV